MANVNIHHVEFPEPAAPGDPVDVVVNNREFVGPGPFSPAACAGGLTNDGHLTDVTLTVRDRSGSTVWSETREVCARAEDVDNAARVEFIPDLEPGTYRLQASLQVRGDNGSDTGRSRAMRVIEDAGDLPGSGDPDPFPGVPAPDPGDGSSSDGNALDRIVTGLGISPTMLVVGVLALLVVAGVAL